MKTFPRFFIDCKNQARLPTASQAATNERRGNFLSAGLVDFFPSPDPGTVSGDYKAIFINVDKKTAYPQRCLLLKLKSFVNWLSIYS